MIDSEGKEIGKVELKGTCQTCKHWGGIGNHFEYMKSRLKFGDSMQNAIRITNFAINNPSGDKNICSNPNNQVTTKHVNWAVFVAGGIPTEYSHHEPITTDREWYCPLWELRKKIELKLTTDEWMEVKYPKHKKQHKKYDDSFHRVTEEEFCLELVEYGMTEKNFWDKI